MAYLPSNPAASLIDVFKAYPEIARPLHEFAEVLMRGPSPLSAGERELIAAYVSQRNQCDFCHGSHLAVASRFGVGPEVAEALQRDIDTAPVAERLKPVLRYVHKLNDAPGEVVRADVDAMLSAGWDERAVCHAALVCGFFNLMNRWVDGLGLTADAKVMEAAGRMLHDRGYRAIRELLDEEVPG